MGRKPQKIGECTREPTSLFYRLLSLAYGDWVLSDMG